MLSDSTGNKISCFQKKEPLTHTCFDFISGPLIGVVSRTPEAEEEDKILERYLMGMKIEEGQLTLPPVSERPDGFDLFYQRRSRRRIYEYEMHFNEDENTENTAAGAGGKEQFSLLVSKYQEKTVDAAETDACGFDEIATEVLPLKVVFSLWNVSAFREVVSEISDNAR